MNCGVFGWSGIVIIPAAGSRESCGGFGCWWIVRGCRRLCGCIGRCGALWIADGGNLGSNWVVIVSTASGWQSLFFRVAVEVIQMFGLLSWFEKQHNKLPFGYKIYEDEESEV